MVAVALFFVSPIDFLKMLKGGAPANDEVQMDSETGDAEPKAGWDVLQEDYGMKHTSLKHWNDDDESEDESEDEEEQADFDTDDDDERDENEEDENAEEDEDEEEDEESEEEEEEEESEDEDEVE